MIRLRNNALVFLFLIAPVASTKNGPSENLRGSKEILEKEEAQARRDLGLDFGGDDYTEDALSDGTEADMYAHIYSRHDHDNFSHLEINHDDDEFHFDVDDDRVKHLLNGLIGDSTAEELFSLGEHHVNGHVPNRGASEQNYAVHETDYKSPLFDENGGSSESYNPAESDYQSPMGINPNV